MPKIRGASLAEHRELVWTELLDAFDTLLLERGYDAVALPDVAARAGMARNTIYNYIDDKADLLTASAQRSAGAVVAASHAAGSKSGASAPERLDDIIRLIVSTFATSSRLVLLLRAQAIALSESRSSDLALFAEQRALVEQIVAEGITNGDFAPVDDVVATVDLMSGVMTAAVYQASNTPERADAIAAHASSFLRAALTPRPD